MKTRIVSKLEEGWSIRVNFPAFPFFCTRLYIASLLVLLGRGSVILVVAVLTFCVFFLLQFLVDHIFVQNPEGSRDYSISIIIYITPTAYVEGFKEEQFQFSLEMLYLLNNIKR